MVGVLVLDTVSNGVFHPLPIVTYLLTQFWQQGATLPEKFPWAPEYETASDGSSQVTDAHNIDPSDQSGPQVVFGKGDLNPPLEVTLYFRIQGNYAGGVAVHDTDTSQLQLGAIQIFVPEQGFQHPVSSPTN